MKNKIYKYIISEVWDEIENHSDYEWLDDENEELIHKKIKRKGRWDYKGILNPKKMHWLANKAYSSWMGQGNRCNNPNCKEYKWYGAKGVKRIWSSREMINWWINSLFLRKNWYIPTCSRKVDLGNYEIGNVELKECSEGAKETKITKKVIEIGRINGLKNSKSVILVNVNNIKKIMEFYSAREGCKQLKKSEAWIKNSIRFNTFIIHNNEKWKPFWKKYYDKLSKEEINKIIENSKINKNSNKICLENITNKEDKIYFNSTKEGSEFLNKNKKYISQIIRKNKLVKYNDKIYKPYVIKE